MSKLNSVMGFLTNHPRAQNKLDYIVRKKDMYVIVALTKVGTLEIYANSGIGSELKPLHVDDHGDVFTDYKVHGYIDSKGKAILPNVKDVLFL